MERQSLKENKLRGVFYNNQRSHRWLPSKKMIVFTAAGCLFDSRAAADPKFHNLHYL